ncbi:MAG: hypothetical protein U1E39_06565 [Planctomycetota bacterium]
MGSTARRWCAAVLGTVVLVSGAGTARAEDAPPPPAAPAVSAAPAVVAGDPPAATPPAATPPAGPASEAPAAPPAPPAAEPPKAAADAAKPEEKPEVLPADVPKATPPPAPTAAEKSAVAGVLPTDAPVSVRPWSEPCCFHGSFSVRYRGRSGDGESDNDLYQYGTLTYRKDSDLGWSGSFYGRLAEDLDGNDDSYVFDSVDDTYDSPVTGRLYHLYASYRFAGGALERVRVGRQDIDGGYPFLVDGVHVLTAPVGCAEFQASGFVGLPAHLYEGSPEGDFIGGLGFSVRPWRGGDFSLEWVYVEDENEFYGDPTNNLITAELRQRVSEWVNGRLWYEQVDDDPRELGLSGTAFSPRLNATFRGSFRTQLEEENALVYDLDPYYAIEQTLMPYWDAHLAVAKSLSDCTTVEVGATGRVLYDQDDEGAFNRQFGRFYATLALDGWPRTCWSFALSGDYWVSDDEDTFAGAFEARYKPSDVFKLAAGVDYSLYRTDLYTASERMDSWNGYVKATYAPWGRWKFDFSVRLEDDDVDTFVTVQASARFEF